jgi:hypothetical protein
MTAEVERVAAETRDLRLRVHALLDECNTFEKQLRERVDIILDQCPLTYPKLDLVDGMGQVLGALLGVDALHAAVYLLGDDFQRAAEDATYPKPEQA